MYYHSIMTGNSEQNITVENISKDNYKKATNQVLELFVEHSLESHPDSAILTRPDDDNKFIEDLSTYCQDPDLVEYEYEIAIKSAWDEEDERMWEIEEDHIHALRVIHEFLNGENILDADLDKIVNEYQAHLAKQYRIELEKAAFCGLETNKDTMKCDIETMLDEIEELKKFASPIIHALEIIQHYDLQLNQVFSKYLAHNIHTTDPVIYIINFIKSKRESNIKNRNIRNSSVKINLYNEHHDNIHTLQVKIALWNNPLVRDLLIEEIQYQENLLQEISNDYKIDIQRAEYDFNKFLSVSTLDEAARKERLSELNANLLDDNKVEVLTETIASVFEELKEHRSAAMKSYAERIALLRSQEEAKSASN